MKKTVTSVHGSRAVNPAAIPWYKFVFVCYFIVCGGAFGYEEAVGKAGPALTLLMTVLIPFIWCLPLALITAELSGMTPDTNEGIFLWIEMAFNDVVAFAAAVVYFLTYLVDLSLYCSLFSTYFTEFYPEFFSGTLYFAVVVVVLVSAVAICALLGVDVIGNLSVVVTCLICAPFVVTLIWGGVAGFINPARDWTAPPPGLNGTSTWADASSPAQLEAINRGLHVVIWSFTGYDSLGNIVLTLQPQHHFPRAVIGAIVLSFLTYSTALIGLLGAPALPSPVPNYRLWVAGYFSDAAYELGGIGLRTVLTIAACLSCYGTFQALMLPVGEQLVELASPKYLDIPILRRKNQRFGTPHYAILVCAVVCAGCSVAPLEGLISALNILHSTVLVLVCLAFIRLRLSQRGRLMLRQFLAVRSDWLVVPLAFCPLVIASWMVIGISWLTTWLAAVGSAAVYLLGVGLFFGCRLRKRRGWLWATRASVDDNDETQRRDNSPLLGRKTNVQ